MARPPPLLNHDSFCPPTGRPAVRCFPFFARRMDGFGVSAETKVTVSIRAFYIDPLTGQQATNKLTQYHALFSSFVQP